MKENPEDDIEKIISWASAMCTLLDRIEMVADDADAIRDLCAGRFDIAEEHGLSVTFEGKTSGADH